MSSSTTSSPRTIQGINGSSPSSSPSSSLATSPESSPLVSSVSLIEHNNKAEALSSSRHLPKIFSSIALTSESPKDMPAPTSNSSPFAAPPILVLVGPSPMSKSSEPTPFYVHANLLTDLSPFFRAALEIRTTDDKTTAGFLEAHTRTLRLPEERVDDFRYFLQWVYTNAASKLADTTYSWNQEKNATVTPDQGAGVCASKSLAPAEVGLWHPRIDPHLPAAGHDRKKGPPAFGPLIRLYLLTDRLCISSSSGLRDQILDRILNVAIATNSVPGAIDVRRIWESTMTDSPITFDNILTISGKLTAKKTHPLRKLILDLYRGMRTGKLLSSETYPTLSPISKDTDMPVNTAEPPHENHNIATGSDSISNESCLYDTVSTYSEEPPTGYPTTFLTDLVLTFIDEVNPRTNRQNQPLQPPLPISSTTNPEPEPQLPAQTRVHPHPDLVQQQDNDHQHARKRSNGSHNSNGISHDNIGSCRSCRSSENDKYTCHCNGDSIGPGCGIVKIGRLEVHRCEYHEH